MTTAFLLFANLWLFARLVVLFRDNAVEGRVWVLKSCVELLALAVLYSFGAAWLLARWWC